MMVGMCQVRRCMERQGFLNQLNESNQYKNGALKLVTII